MSYEIKENGVRILVTGAEAIVQGALDSDCNFFAGYPITPASEILEGMIVGLPGEGGRAIQAEDEIAALGSCIGAVSAGARAMTATSGPGISLMSEHIGMAIMLELPLVIVDCQRMGPATGGATAVAQGDIQFLRWGWSGGPPTIVLAPTNTLECYSLTQKAFDLAERFRSPVILATDAVVVRARTTLRAGELDDLKIEVRERKVAAADDPFTPYKFRPPSETSPFSPFGGPHLVRTTASAHNEQGLLTKDPETLEALQEHLEEKITAQADEIALMEADFQADAKTLIISYGVTANSMNEAVRCARDQGKKVSALTLYSLWPVPEQKIRQALEGIEQVIVPELNTGQYRREIERLAGPGQNIIGVNRVDGQLIFPEQIIGHIGVSNGKD